MTSATKTARLTLTLPEDLHRDIKARAKQEGKTIHHYVLERLMPEKSEQDREDYDVKDVNVEIAQALHEMKKADEKGIQLPHIDTLIPRLR